MGMRISKRGIVKGQHPLFRRPLAESTLSICDGLAIAHTPPFLPPSLDGASSSPFPPRLRTGEEDENLPAATAAIGALPLPSALEVEKIARVYPWALSWEKGLRETRLFPPMIGRKTSSLESESRVLFFNETQCN